MERTMQIELLHCPHCSRHALVRIRTDEGFQVTPGFATSMMGHLTAVCLAAGMSLSEIQQSRLHRAIDNLGLPDRLRDNNGVEVGSCLSILNARAIVPLGGCNPYYKIMHQALGTAIHQISEMLEDGLRSLRGDEVHSCHRIYMHPVAGVLTHLLRHLVPWVQELRDNAYRLSDMTSRCPVEGIPFMEVIPYLEDPWELPEHTHMSGVIQLGTDEIDDLQPEAAGLPNEETAIDPSETGIQLVDMSDTSTGMLPLSMLQELGLVAETIGP